MWQKHQSDSLTLVKVYTNFDSLEVDDFFRKQAVTRKAGSTTTMVHASQRLFLQINGMTDDLTLTNYNFSFTLKFKDFINRNVMSLIV